MSEKATMMNGDCRVVNSTHPPSPLSLSTAVTVGDVSKSNGVARKNAWINKPQISVEQADESSPMSSPLSSPPGVGPTRSDDSCLRVRTQPYPKTPPASYKYHTPVNKPEYPRHVESGEEDEEDMNAVDVQGRESGHYSDFVRKDLLQVLSSSPRSHSLPLGVKMDAADLHRISSNSDETADSEGSPLERRKVIKVHDRMSDLKREDSIGSDLSLPESCSSSDDSSSDGTADDTLHNQKLFKGDETITSPTLEQEDDVFNDREAPDTQEEADTKLMNWACNDFVPACHQLLTRCSESRTKSAQKKSADVQADLRSLSNTITFFCSEQQQRLSQVFLIKPMKLRGISQSVSTQTFPRPISAASISSGESGESTGDRSYAVKVLRSASQSLIAPLLFEATQREGFTPSLHQSIIKALQKIAWKVEACLSFSNPNNTADIHAMIFDEEHAERVKDMMIRALPPAEPKLPIGPPPGARANRKVSEPCMAGKDFSHPIKKRRGTSMKERPGGVVLEPETLPADLRSIGESEEELDEDDEVWKASREGEGGGGGEEEEEEEGGARKEGEETEEREQEEERETKGAEKDDSSPSKESHGSRNGIPNLPRRERIATEGEADLLSRPLSRQTDFGSIPNLDRQDSQAVSELENRVLGARERYFRPRAYRRTTVSLSRKEVQKLGLTVAKRVDESILEDIKALRAREAAAARVNARKERGREEKEGAEKEREREREDKEREWDDKDREVDETRREVVAEKLRAEADEASTDGPIEDPQDADRVRHRLHNKLTQEFSRIRSASASDILDSDTSSLPDPDIHLRVPSEPSPQAKVGDVFGSPPPGTVKLVPLSDKPAEGGLLRRMNSDSTVLSSSPQPSPNYEKSYTPVRRATDAALVPDDEWEFVRPEKRKSSIKGRAKEKVKKSLSSSGKFAHSLIKTARSLRNGSVSSKQKKLSKSLSAEDLLDDSVRPKPSHRTETSSSDPSRFSVSMSPTPHSPTPYDARTLPAKSSRMNTLARIMRGKSKTSRSNSFGKSEKQSRGASWHQADFSAGGSLTESIESVSRNAVCSVSMEGEEQLLISVELASKLQKKQAIRLRSTSIIGKESSGNPWFQITVNTNIKEFGRTHYIILRPFKEIQRLCDSLPSYHGAVDLPLPDKKVGTKRLKMMEDLLRSIAGTAHLRRNQVFVNFLMPDDQFGSFTESDHSEVSFERLMTFYTPDIHSGPPGSFPSVQMVPADHVPATPSPDVPRKSSLTGHKKGSMHFMKRDGKEDPSTFVIQEEGEDALIVAYEDDRYVVVAGTFEKLVEQLACEEKPDPRFVTTFLLGYRHFAKALDFLTKLLDRFHMTVPPNATEEEMAYAEKWSYVIQLRVLDILTYWMKKCWPDLYRNPPVLEKAQEFAKFLKATDDHNFQYAGTNIEKIIAEKMASSTALYTLPPDSTATFTSSTSPTSPGTQVQPLPGATSHTPPADAARRSPVSSLKSGSSAPTSPQHYPHVSRRVTSSSSSYCGLDICTIPAIQLARQLTLIELDFLRAIDVHELVVYTWDPNTPENKPFRRNLDAFIERFNKVSYWVASEICYVEDARLRGILIEKFIEVAKFCHEYKNFNTTISVLSGLSLAAVRRLKRSWDLVNEKTRKWFAKLQPLTAPATNHRNYRRALASVHRRDPCIPYFGVFMRDLTFFNDGNKKRLKNGLYNFSKLRTMVYKFEELKRYQRSKYFFPPEDKTREFCRNLWCMSESELYDASLRIEPREVPPETAV